MRDRRKTVNCWTATGRCKSRSPAAILVVLVLEVSSLLPSPAGAVPAYDNGDGDGERLFVRVGGNATLACPDLPPGAGPPRHLLWWKEDRRLIEATRDRVTVAPDAGPRVSLLPGSSALVFRSVLAQDSGEYQCVVNNRQGRRGLVRLFVQGNKMASTKTKLSLVPNSPRDIKHPV
ncbi:neurotrimin-like [Ixodes scapularis]